MFTDATNRPPLGSRGGANFDFEESSPNQNSFSSLPCTNTSRRFFREIEEEVEGESVCLASISRGRIFLSYMNILKRRIFEKNSFLGNICTCLIVKKQFSFGGSLKYF